MEVNSNNACIGASSTETITITTDPLPLAEITSNQDPICENGITTLVGEATDGIGSWIQTSGKGSLENSNATVIFNADGVGRSNFKFTVISNNTCHVSNSVTKYASLTTDQLPKATIEQVNPSDSVCLKEDLLIKSGIAIISNATAKWFHNGLGTIINDEITTPTYEVADDDEKNTITLTLVATSNNACADEIDNAIYNIYVRSLPTGYIMPGEDQCENGEQPIISLVASSTKAPYAFTFYIDTIKTVINLEGEILDLKNNYGKRHDLFAATIKEAIFTYSLQFVTDAYGCISDTIVADNTDTITIHRKP
jgi:hypothetical protein